MNLNNNYSVGITLADASSLPIGSSGFVQIDEWASTWILPSLGNRQACSDNWQGATFGSPSQINLHWVKDSVVYLNADNSPYDHFNACRWQDFRPHWLQVAESDVHCLTLDSVQTIMLDISELLAKRAFTSVNQGLNLATLSNMSQDAIMAILRITFSARNLLSGWINFLNRGEEVFALRDLSLASIVSLRIAASR